MNLTLLLLYTLIKTILDWLTPAKWKVVMRTVKLKFEMEKRILWHTAIKIDKNFEKKKKHQMQKNIVTID